MSTSTAVIALDAIELFERPVVLRLPFRFGIVTLTECPQAFVRIRIRSADGHTHWGVAAEMMAPKWFDKNPHLSNEENFEQLRSVLFLAHDAYLSDLKPASAFAHFARHYDQHLRVAAARGFNPLLANYGPAMIDRAIIDALCRANTVSFYRAMQSNLAGIDEDAELGGATPFKGMGIDGFLQGRVPSQRVHARHTVGLVDTISNTQLLHRANDGLPETLQQVVAHYGHRYFKLKVAGEVASDLDRLQSIAAVLDQIPERYCVTLDGNEQYESAEQLGQLLARMRGTPKLQRLLASILFIEQPINRKTALQADFNRTKLGLPVLIDESDGTLDAFTLARARGYSGVSSKTCKGIYKSVLNAARCAAWNELVKGARFFMSAEDLTTQAGVAVQQDLALVNLLGIGHVERNGHHYVNGMAALPPMEQQRFLSLHSDLYEHSHGAVRLRISSGELAIGSLDCVGYASNALPDFSAMTSMQLQQN